MLAALGAVLLWSTVATAFKLSLDALTVAELLAYSSLVSFLALCVVILLRRAPAGLRQWPLREYAHSALLGLINPFAYYLVLFSAYDRLPAQEAQPLNYTWPLVLALFSTVFLRQRIRRGVYAAMVVSFAGVWIISTRGDVFALRFSDPLGVGLAMGSSVLWAAYWMLTMRSTADPEEKLLVNAGFGSLYTLLFLAVTEGLRVPSLAGALGASYVGVFEMGLTFVLWLRALKLSSTTARVGALVYLSPFLSLVLIHFVVGEDIAASTLVGLVLIVAGIAVQQVIERKSARGNT